MSGSIHWGPRRVRSIHDRIGVASRTARLMLAELRRLLRPHATPAARQRSRSEGAEGLFEYPIAVKARVSARKWIPASEWLQLARASLLRQVWTVCKESISRIRFASANGRYLRIADMRRERLNVVDRRQAEWGAGLEVFEESVLDWPRSGRSSRAAFSRARRPL